jgi:ABC-type spermidine/putrescine transport system permease subunit I
LLGYPLAYGLVRTPYVLAKSAILITAVTPLFLGEVVRTYSWIIVLGNSGFVNAMLLNRMTDDGVWLFTSDDFPWLLILLGIAFLALERVMAQAVTLREDTEATI